jgi:hypothetical protein
MQDPPNSGQSKSSRATYQTEYEISRIVASIDRLRAQLEENHQQSHATDKQRHDREIWTVRGILIYTGLTLIIAGSSIYQAHVFKETEERQLRAYAEIGPINIVCCSDPNVSGAPINEIRIPVINKGQTPMEFLSATLSRMEYPLTERFPDPFKCKGTYSIPERPHHADLVTTQSAREENFEVDDDTIGYIKDAREKRGWIIFCGSAIYQDIFGDKWNRRFYFEYKYPFVGSEIVYCPDGNEEVPFKVMTRSELMKARRDELNQLPEVPSHSLAEP